MRAFMKRNRLWTPCVLLLLTFAMALYAQLSLNAIPGTFQYLWPAPVPTAGTPATDGQAETPAVNTGLKQARLTMETILEQLAGAAEPTSLTAIADGVSVIADMDGATAVSARLEALDENAYALRSFLLKSGRLIYEEEYELGTRVVMVDEKLAVALFNYAEPIERTLLIGDVKYRIVGIVNDQKSVGDHLEYTLYVPYRAMERSGLALSALCIESKPVPNAGGWAAFESATASVSTQGTTISLHKEKMNAALPLRVLGCFFGLMAVLFCIKALNVQAIKLHQAYQQRLRTQYAARLMPWLTGRGLLLGMGYAACAFVFAQLFMVFIAPVYTFPEWIPTVLVEPNDISTAFWNVWQKQAALFELRSPELIRIGYFGRLMGWACGGMALAGGLLAARVGDMMRALTQKPEPLEGSRS